MALSFAHMWQQQEASDVDVLLLTQDRVELARFPAHRVLLTNSPVFRAKMLRWQQDEEQPPAPKAKRPRRSSAANNNDSSSNPEPTATSTARGRLELQLQDASKQPAATAVLASLYAVKPLPELLSELPQEQQLLAALLADQWQVPNLSSAAAQLLADAANSGALAAAVRQRVLQDALPDCLQPLLKSVVLSVLGDLEAVWADADLSEQLLRLSLPAMELLLSADSLKVASEDTVLYTAHEYIQDIEDGQQQKRAQQQLAALIRCPHLSSFWLSLAAIALDKDDELLAGVRPHLQKLLLLREAKGNYQVTASSLQAGGLLAGAPSSWALGSRVITPVASVQLVWQLEVSELKAAAQSTAKEQESRRLWCPHESPPLGGMAFTMFCFCAHGREGVTIGLFAGPTDLPAVACYTFKGVVEVVGLAAVRVSTPEPMSNNESKGCLDVFDIGAMAGGWDEVAWARKGLPSSGCLTIKLTVSGVPHAALVPPAPRAGRARAIVL